MATQTLTLTNEQAEVVRQIVARGGYTDASQVLDEALRLLVSARGDAEADVELLRAEVQKGIDAFERGDFIELDSEEAIEALSADIRRRGRERLAKEADAPAAPTQ